VSDNEPQSYPVVGQALQDSYGYQKYTLQKKIRKLIDQFDDKEDPGRIFPFNSISNKI